MIQDLPTFKFILFDGVTTWDLPQAPDGWEESFIEWQRSLTNYGIIRNYSIPLKWTLDGAFFLRNTFYKKGIQAFTRLTIQKLVPASLEYNDFYVGTIDYSSLTDTNVFVEVSLMDSGLASSINAYMNTKYEIPLESGDAVDVMFNGIELNETATYITDAVPNIDAAIENVNVIIGSTLQAFEQRTNVATAQSTDYEGENIGDPAPVLASSTNWFYQASTTTTVHVEGTMSFSSIQSSGNLIKLLIDTFITRFGVSPFQNFMICDNVPVPLDDHFHDFSFPFSFDIPMVSGDKLFLRYISNGPFGEPYGTRIIPEQISITAIALSTPTTAKALRADNVFEKLIGKVSGLQNRTQSFLLGNDFSTFYYTSGDALRRLSGASIKISLKDFIRDWFGIACAGLGVENERAVLERRDYFFRRGQKIDSLGLVQSAIFEIAEDLVFNTIKTGSPNQDVDELNGRAEVNSEVEFTTPITKISQLYDILTTSRTDAYGIEFTRINLEGKPTTDASQDNDPFIIDVVEEDGEYRAAVAADRYLSVTGVPAPNSVYNLKLSPKQNLLRHNYFIASMMWGQEDRYINFQSALKNKDLITTDLSGNVVVESDNIYIQNLGDKLYYPITATIKTKYNKNLVSLINNTPYGYLEFTWYDNVYRGYILEASFNPGNYEDKEFKLLLTPDNNLLSLIR